MLKELNIPTEKDNRLWDEVQRQVEVYNKLGIDLNAENYIGHDQIYTNF